MQAFFATFWIGWFNLFFLLWRLKLNTHMTHVFSDKRKIMHDKKRVAVKRQQHFLQNQYLNPIENRKILSLFQELHCAEEYSECFRWYRNWANFCATQNIDTIPKFTRQSPARLESIVTFQLFSNLQNNLTKSRPKECCVFQKSGNKQLV